jgi:hypothetical protein
LESKEFIELKEFIPGDYEYISFNAWIMAKANKTNYYECFLKLVS